MQATVALTVTWSWDRKRGWREVETEVSWNGATTEKLKELITVIRNTSAGYAAFVEQYGED